MKKAKKPVFSMYLRTKIKLFKLSMRRLLSDSEIPKDCFFITIYYYSNDSETP